MFYDVFKKLCDEKGITPTKASTEIGFSKGSVSYWKSKWQQGKDSKPDSYTAAKIADYFGVSVDYLLGRTDDPVDYSDEDLIATQSPAVLSHFDGDVKRAVAFQEAVDADVAAERRGNIPEVFAKYNMLDGIDRAKVEAYIDGLLSADKYRTELQAKNA